MRKRLKQGMTWLAIYAVALHVILLGLAPIAANGAALVPLSVICHSVDAVDAPADDSAGKSSHVPGRACEHCNLCSAAAPPSAPDVAVVIELPLRVIRALGPASAAPRPGLAVSPKLARGPPQPT